MRTDIDFMRVALDQARRAAGSGEAPVGAVAVLDDEIIAEAHNSPIARLDPTAHAEILVLRQTARSVGAYRLPGLAVYVTLEPCMMCFGALLHARVERLVYGASDPKVGFSAEYGKLRSSVRFNHAIEVAGGVLAEESAQLLKDFFRARR